MDKGNIELLDFLYFYAERNLEALSLNLQEQMPPLPNKENKEGSGDGSNKQKMTGNISSTTPILPHSKLDNEVYLLRFLFYLKLEPGIIVFS